GGRDAEVHRLPRDAASDAARGDRAGGRGRQGGQARRVRRAYAQPLHGRGEGFLLDGGAHRRGCREVPPGERHPAGDGQRDRGPVPGLTSCRCGGRGPRWVPSEPPRGRSTYMRYAVLFYAHEQAMMESMGSPGGVDEHVSAFASWSRDVGERLTGGAPLAPSPTATTVRVRNGDIITTDG